MGRIDRVYDLTILCLHMTTLSLTLYLFNLADDGRWKNTILEKYVIYFPLAIQFFFGGLSSAYVIYFSRSVSLSKTIAFFVILLLLLVANEFLKKRIENKYLQFGVYSFISFTFFAFMIPVFIKKISTTVFIFSGIISLTCTLLLITFIYRSSPSTRKEVKLNKLIGIVLSIYFAISLFYFLRLIPPVPLAMENGIVAHNIEKIDNTYSIRFEREKWYVFWRSYKEIYHRDANEPVYVFTSIFAPTELKKKIYHRWSFFDSGTDDWTTTEDIGYTVEGGRDDGYRGYTFKTNVWDGLWKVEVITEEELVLGVVKFEIITQNSKYPPRIVEKKF